MVDLLTRAGPSNNASVMANVGDGILRRWIIVFDYPHQQLQLRPGGDPSGSVIHDHSGIVLMTKANALVAAQVLGGTPAANAGITDCAQLVAVDGTAVSAADLDRIRAMFRGAPGTVFRLQLADGTTREITLQKYL